MLANPQVDVDDDEDENTTKTTAAIIRKRAPSIEEPAPTSSDSVASSDDTVFLDLPLPPVPCTVHAVRVQNVDAASPSWPATGSTDTYVVFGGEARLYSRL